MQQINSAVLTALLPQTADPFETGTSSQVDCVPGEPGRLTFEEIVLLLSYAEVLSFNRRSDAQLEFGCSSFYVTTPGWPQYVFNEEAAPEAIVSGHLLWMPDAQGFGCTFVLDCVVDSAKTRSAGASNV